MNPRAFVIREFKSGRAFEKAVDFESGFARCIELYREHGKTKSFYVEAVSL